MSIHSSDHPQAGEWVTVTTTLPLPEQSDTTVEYRVQNWWDKIVDGSSFTQGNPACMHYAARVVLSGLPADGEVVYGHTRDGVGHLVHVSEITTGGEL
jgi:hypothetical protein